MTEGETREDEIKSPRSARITSTLRAVGNQLSVLPQHSGQMSNPEGRSKVSPAGNPLGGVPAAEDPSAHRGEECLMACSRRDKPPGFRKRAFQ